MNAFTFYATVDSDSISPKAMAHVPAGLPLLLPASSWARKRLAPPKLPAHLAGNVAADSGGFVATFHWGDYRYTPAEYVTWLDSFHPRWAATMDYCCEPEITGQNDGVVAERQRRTTEMAWLFWRQYRRAAWAWVPTVQGWEPDDYVRHARALRPLIEEMRDYYGSGSPDWRVGIGTLCRRASVSMIQQVTRMVAHELPGVPLHLWGVKLAILSGRVALPDAVASVDSAAWNGLTHAKEREVYHAWRDSGRGTQREYSYQFALPRYLDKVERALSSPKQLTLLDVFTTGQTESEVSA